jgi:hypothetical protein
MQDSYGTMFDEGLPTADSTRQIVDIAWTAGYGRVWQRLKTGQEPCCALN